MTNSEPLVSILIPAYNAGRWIEQTIQSALAQTWRRKELIVVDDGSTDNTASIAARYATHNVVVIRKDNEGAASTRNVATARSNGDYIQWLDADDLLATDKIERQLRLAGKSPDPLMLLSGAWGRFSYRPHRAVFQPSALWADLTPVEWLLRKLEGNLHMQTATWLTSRPLTEAAGQWDARMTYDDDGEFFCRVLLKSNGTRFEPSSLVYWRDVPGSRVSYIGTSDPKMDAMLLSMKLHIQYLRVLEDSPRSRAACFTYIRNCASTFHPRRQDIRQMLTQMAADLGYDFVPDALRKKYSWLQRLFGENFAWRCQLEVPRIRARLRCETEYLKSLFDDRAGPPGVGSKSVGRDAYVGR